MSKWYKKVSDNRLKLQKLQAMDIQTNLAGLPLDHPVSLTDIPTFERALGYRIIVVCVERLNKVIYRGSTESTKTVYVLLTPPEEKEISVSSTGHYDLILTMAGFLGCEKFCEKCFRSCGRNHQCESQCKTCNTVACKEVSGKTLVSFHYFLLFTFIIIFFFLCIIIIFYYRRISKVSRL